MKNLKKFEALIKKYRSITFERIEKYWIRRAAIMGCTDGEDVAKHFTGFGSKNTCKLCEYTNGVSLPCYDCIYSYTIKNNLQFPCTKEGNAATFKKIKYASTPRALYNAYQARAKHMEKTLKSLENRGLVISVGGKRRVNKEEII